MIGYVWTPWVSCCSIHGPMGSVVDDKSWGCKPSSLRARCEGRESQACSLFAVRVLDAAVQPQNPILSTKGIREMHPTNIHLKIQLSDGAQ